MNIKLAKLLEEIYDIMDRLEEAAEDDESISEKVNAAIDKMSDVCDILEDE